MLTAALFIAITLTCYILSLSKGPIWGLISYAYIYFINPRLNWWGEYLPDVGWSLLSSGILLASIIIHRDKLSTHKYSLIYFIFIFYLFIELIASTIAVSPIVAKTYTYQMMTYCIIIFMIIKILAKYEQLRLFVLIIIVMGAILGMQSLSEGKFLEGRLNNIGPADARGSNEFGLLLGSILPFTFPFIVRGKRYEKAICYLSLPFIINGFTLTVSRGALVSTIGSVCYVFFCIANNKIKKYLLYAVLCVIPFYLFFIDADYVDRVSSLWKSDLTTDRALNDVSTGRTDIWKYSFPMLKDYPFGAGPGGFRVLSPDYLPKESLNESGVRAAHNSYLLVLIELGYLGLFCYLIICFAVMFILFKSFKKITQINKDKNKNFIELLIITLNMSVACTLIGGFFGSLFYYEFFWWQVALSVVAYSFVLELEIEAKNRNNRIVK